MELEFLLNVILKHFLALQLISLEMHQAIKLSRLCYSKTELFLITENCLRSLANINDLITELISLMNRKKSKGPR